MRTYFAPGCTMMLYSGALARRIQCFLEGHFGEVTFLDRCCQHEWELPAGSRLIDICPGCHQRYVARFVDCEVITLYEWVAGLIDFDYPDYGGRVMTVHDACSTRQMPGVMDAVRTLAGRMGIVLEESVYTRERGMCCGDSVYSKLPPEDYTAFARRRCGHLPCDEAIVYCVSCVKSINHGGRTPRHLAGLLFGEDNMPIGEADPVAWHLSIRAYKDALAGVTSVQDSE